MLEVNAKINAQTLVMVASSSRLCTSEQYKDCNLAVLSCVQQCMSVHHRLSSALKNTRFSLP